MKELMDHTARANAKDGLIRAYRRTQRLHELITEDRHALADKSLDKRR